MNRTTNSGRANNLVYHFMSLALTAFLPSSMAQPCAPLPPGIVSWWPGDGNANDIQDGNHGALVSGVTFTPGMVGQAFRFDGANRYVDLGNNESLNPTTAFTVEAWIRLDSFADKWGGAGFIIASGRDCCGWSGGGIGLHLAGFQTPRAYFYRPDNWQVEVRGAAMSANAWHHIVVTFDGTRLQVYQDSLQTGLATFSATTVKPGTQHMQIGRHPDCLFGACYPFHGLIDEVKLYNRALSASEIQSNYDAGSAGNCKPLEECEQAVAAAQQQISLLEAQLAEANAQIKSLNGQLAEANAEIKSLKGANTVLTVENGLLKKQVSDLTAENDQLKKQVSALMTENAQLKAQVKALTEENGQLKDQVKALSAERDQLQQQVQDLTSQLNLLKTTLATGLTQVRDTLRTLFNDPSFVIPGATLQEQYQNLIAAIANLSKGRLEGLYVNLGGKLGKGSQ